MYVYSENCLVYCDLWQVLVSLDEAAAICNSHHLAVVRVLYDFHPHSPYELRLRKVRSTFPRDQFYHVDLSDTSMTRSPW